MTKGPELRWFKSTYSGGSGTECVECAATVEGALIRDSKQPSCALIAVGMAAWVGFIQAVQGARIG
ncbi:DUF397 domain-containing protein [Streptomyces sp. NBC_00466]|uniref:DUF397 domain-containing protein n=1 Tax=Streptomyces sp. NBC_00466 TaxID=2903655 RepID=UPI0030E583B4